MTSHRRPKGYRPPFDPGRHAERRFIQALAADPWTDAVEAACKSLASWGAVEVEHGIDYPTLEQEHRLESRPGQQTLWFTATTADGRTVRAEHLKYEPFNAMDVLALVAVILRGQGVEVTS